MNAAILAAGLGTRLRPLTYQRPKALVPILNQPLLGILLAQLREAGAGVVAVNTHHLAADVDRYLDEQGPWGLDLKVSHEPEILGTGGGLRGLASLLGEDRPFLAVNSDILADVDLGALFVRHREGALSTLVLHDCPPFNNVWIDADHRVVGIGAPTQGSVGPPLAYTGVQVVGTGLCRYLPPSGPADLVTIWRQALGRGESLEAVVVSGHFWQEVGSPGAYLEAHRRLQAGEGGALRRFFPAVTDPLLGEGTVLDEEVVCAGAVCLGRNVRVGRGVRLASSVAWDGAIIEPGVSLESCVVGAGAKVRRAAQEEILL